MNATKKQFIIYDKQFHFVVKICYSVIEKNQFLSKNENVYCLHDFC